MMFNNLSDLYSMSMVGWTLTIEKELTVSKKGELKLETAPKLLTSKTASDARDEWIASNEPVELITSKL